MLRHKQSKTDTNHTGVLIMLAATNDATCPVTALRSLFTHNPQPPHNGMLDEDIQKLGRWTSASFRLYFVASAQTLYNLNMNFKTGRPVALPRANQ